MESKEYALEALNESFATFFNKEGNQVIIHRSEWQDMGRPMILLVTIQSF